MARDNRPMAVASAMERSDRTPTISEVESSFASLFDVKLHLFNSLQVLVMVSLALIVWSCCWSLVYLKAHVPLSYWHRIVLATGVLLLWSSFVGYLDHNRHVYSIVLTLRWGIPRVLQFLLGVSPIFLGFALFGTVAFGNRLEQFGTLSASTMTLFSVMNGDVILDTFDALSVHFPVTGKVYLYSFISLFMYVVLNIFIAIVEEAFFSTRSCRRMFDLLNDAENLCVEGEDGTVRAMQQAQKVSLEKMRMLLRVLESRDMQT